MVAQAFRIQVRSALEHLHDSVALEVHPLLAELREPQRATGRSGAGQLRALLTTGIDDLRPRSDLPPDAPAWRSYQALHARYMQGLAIGEIERVLGISRRQVQRELRKALDALSALLWQRRCGASTAQTAPPAPDSPTQPRHTASPVPSRPLEQHLLLSTKLARPRVPTALVARERLLHQLDHALMHRLTLLSASAGWGKTTLLASWLAERQKAKGKRQNDGNDMLLPFTFSLLPFEVAWLSLDVQDNQPAHFWLAIIAALRGCVPSAGQGALAMLHAPEPPPLSAMLTVLLNDLASVAQSTTLLLILDDYHLVDDQAIHEGMAFFLEHLPDQLHLILASRVDPPLPLARWRMRGELLEIRAADLRFTTAEASSFFTQALGESLAEDDVLRLGQRTEGWVAGLQLAALAMRQRQDRSAFVQAFTGSHRYLLDYVQEEILQHQPLNVQRFLLQTVVLRRLNAGVCAALTGEATSQAMLEMLERSNLFVVPLDDQRQWYRMHDLFREVLLARLQASEPELVPRLHQRAARWYAAHGELREAIVHALAAADFWYAAELIEREAPHLWLSGEAQTVQAWILALPDAVLLQHARLALNTALRLLESLHLTVREVYARGRAQVEQTIARLEAALQSQPGVVARSAAAATLPALPAADVALIQRRIRLLQMLIASRAILTRGDEERMHLLVQEAEALATQEELNWKLIGLWLSFWHMGTLQQAVALLIPKLQEARRHAQEASDHPATLRVMRWLALVYVRSGQWHLAQQECLEALALVEQIGQRSAMTGYFHYSLASTYYAWNRLDEAAASAQQLQQIAELWQQADLLLNGDVLLAQIWLARGDLAAAEQALQQAEELSQQEQYAPNRGPTMVARVQYWLAAGDLDAARAWAERAVFDPAAWNPNRTWACLPLIRVYLAQQQYTEALEMLERFSIYLDRPGDIERAIAFLALQVVALHQAGKREQARSVTARLVALTEPEDNLRVYLDAGEPMQQVLLSLLEPPRDQASALPSAAIAFVAKLLAAFPNVGVQNEPPIQPPTSNIRNLIEPLTEREQEVLGLLAAGASNQQIAAELVISLATVKKHVSNLLGKLGVASRTQAIARAREWSLLPHRASSNVRA